MTPLSQIAREELAPGGRLRLGLNYQNFLLVLGDGPDGLPRGIAPDIGRELARRLGASIEYVKFDAAGKLADAIASSAVDVGFIGAEPQRAQQIAFTAAYLEIPITFLVPAGSPIRTLADIDQPGVRISVSERSAYDLYLTRNLKHAKLHRADGIQGSFDEFVAMKLEALGGLKPRLVSDQQKLAGSRILEGQISAVQQAIGTPRARKTGASYLKAFAEEVKASGMVAEAIARHKVAGVNVAPGAE